MAMFMISLMQSFLKLALSIIFPGILLVDDLTFLLICVFFHQFLRQMRYLLPFISLTFIHKRTVICSVVEIKKK